VDDSLPAVRIRTPITFLEGETESIASRDSGVYAHSDRELDLQWVKTDRDNERAEQIAREAIAASVGRLF
jgi:hypothetical protein